MIAKVKVGKSFGGTIRYLYEGHKEQAANKQAELLDYNGIRPDMESMIKDFNRHRWLNPDLGNAVGHISISYHPQDSQKATNQAMTLHARQFMQKMGIDPETTQWALIRHHDREHEHFHLVYNRVDYNGQTISDAHSYKRSHEATQALSLQYGLTLAAQAKKDLARTHLERLPGHDQERYKIYQALTKEVSQAKSIDELRKTLKENYSIETITQKKGQGISFKTGLYAFKASEVDRAYTGGKIYAQIEQNYHQSQQQELLKGFGALSETIKQRDQQKAFNQLADLIKERDTKKAQEQNQTLNQNQTTKKDQSRGKGIGY